MCDVYFKNRVPRKLYKQQNVGVQADSEILPGYYCIAKLIYVLLKERLAEIHSATL